mgnify:CR=1 FL=1
MNVVRKIALTGKHLGSRSIDEHKTKIALLAFVWGTFGGTEHAPAYLRGGSVTGMVSVPVPVPVQRYNPTKTVLNRSVLVQVLGTRALRISLGLA